MFTISEKAPFDQAGTSLDSVMLFFPCCKVSGILPFIVYLYKGLMISILVCLRKSSLRL